MASGTSMSRPLADRLAVVGVIPAPRRAREWRCMRPRCGSHKAIAGALVTRRLAPGGSALRAAATAASDGRRVPASPIVA